ncbi:DUF599 domain-containing protein [Pontivivens nitratireducens]|jgi:uncharacterized membrane protein|uniref:DUF599 domain-containing protein n=1 Tax=Pontivivens nitratireducens TaxID=2758038 RepID=A0A6G7VP81_9RHOB|nr:DUF599 domain-containing protein [Pontibrevibacter nitratireducens]QIK41597.1 DUF599 domain-containing protein [Pontibrevibacter nitratireducens]
MQIDVNILLNSFDLLDLVALALFWSCWLTTTFLIERDNAKRPSVHVLMKRHRYRWMEEMAARDVRIFDSAILASIQQSTAFFGSTTLLVIGGIVAILGKPETLLSAGEGLMPDWSSQTLQLELLMVLGIAFYAFLKFVWSNRLFSYCAVVMASMPNDGTVPEAGRIAIRAARLNSYAARSFNRGLRGIYYALTAMAWVLGAEALIVATVVTTAVLIRREFFSRSRKALIAS